ncbi:hypothetical protein TanjilG_04787 [Lupinus angustifolius]|uniref:CST complex subunit TEN1 n=1 Tax=Lupinus angustifolius TaxID=3871 RepID=A0A4P1QS05_LUPAN|nr:hypothetical protein TanjilG_04787 [Lupinus angustifolius]
MALFEIKSGALVTLQELHPSSPFFKQGASLRITGKLHAYSLESGIATIIDGDDTLKVSTEHLRDLSFRVGSVYQFIGELCIEPENEVKALLILLYLARTLGYMRVLQARVGRNVDGIDLNLYHQSLLLLRQFQANHLNNPAT